MRAQPAGSHYIGGRFVDGSGPVLESRFPATQELIASLREADRATVDAAVNEDEVYVSITLIDGTKLATHVEHATGSPENPMSDEALRAKFDTLTAEVFDAGRSAALWDAVWTLDRAENVDEVVRLMQPGRGTRAAS